MFNRKKLATLGVTSALALALVGVGVGAQFSDAVDATQNISTGTAQLQIVDPWGDGVVSPDGKSVTYTLENAGSNLSAVHAFYVKNVGTLPMHNVKLSISGSGDPELTDNLWSYVMDDEKYDVPWAVVGSVTELFALPDPVLEADYTIYPEAVDPAHSQARMVMYFGPMDWEGGLPNAAQGKSMTFTVTVDAVDGIGTEPWYGEGPAPLSAEPKLPERVAKAMSE